MKKLCLWAIADNYFPVWGGLQEKLLTIMRRVAWFLFLEVGNPKYSVSLNIQMGLICLLFIAVVTAAIAVSKFDYIEILWQLGIDFM